jgi:hypothetical protein
MANIKTTCPKCRRPLWAKPEQAGKRVRCPGCKQILTVPEPSAAEVEALAAAALADTPDGAGVEPQGPIKFHCSFCDEEVQVPGELAGKRTPCPACSRIVKVPMRVKEAAPDWRQVQRGAAAGVLRTGEKPPEGEWGTATASSKVTQQSLEEAEVIPIPKQPVRVSAWIIRAVGAASIIVFVVAVIFMTKRIFSQSNQREALTKALAASPSHALAKLTGADAAEVYRAAGEYYLGVGDTVKALNLLRLAREHAANSAHSAQRDFALIDIALAQVEFADKTARSLGGNRPWNDKELGQVLHAIANPEAKARALRRVSRSLIEKGQIPLAETLARTLHLGPGENLHELVAIVGLELLATGHANEAQSLAQSLAAPFQAKGKRPPLSPSLLALLIGTDQLKLAESIAGSEVKGAVKDPYPEVRIGFSRGLALQGKWAEANQVAGSPGPKTQRLDAYLAVAAGATTANPEQSRATIEHIMDLQEGFLQSSSTSSDWLLLRLVEIGLQVRLPQDRLQSAVEAMHDDAFRNRARAEILQARLKRLEGPDPEHEIEKLANRNDAGKLLELVCRHDARHDRSASLLRALDRWEPASLRPFGYIGVALGEQDSGR